jgi:hypothetical protein
MAQDQSCAGWFPEPPAKPALSVVHQINLDSLILWQSALRVDMSWHEMSRFEGKADQSHMLRDDMQSMQHSTAGHSISIVRAPVLHTVSNLLD